MHVCGRGYGYMGDEGTVWVKSKDIKKHTFFFFALIWIPGKLQFPLIQFLIC